MLMQRSEPAPEQLVVQPLPGDQQRESPQPGEGANARFQSARPIYAAPERVLAQPIFQQSGDSARKGRISGEGEGPREGEEKLMPVQLPDPACFARLPVD